MRKMIRITYCERVEILFLIYNKIIKFYKIIWYNLRELEINVELFYIETTYRVS